MTELGDNHVCTLQALGAGPWVTGAGGEGSPVHSHGAGGSAAVVHRCALSSDRRGLAGGYFTVAWATHAALGS